MCLYRISIAFPVVTTAAVNVKAAVATRLTVAVQPPSSVAAGEAFALTVRALDRFGNLATTFAKPAHWSDAPPPAPAEPKPDEADSPTRYGDWVKDGIAVDF